MDERETVIDTGALARQRPVDLAGGQFPGYVVVRMLGQGGMGAVYLAKQVKLDRLVVIKVISPDLAAQPEIVGRLHREAHAVAKVSSDHVVQVFDCDTAFGVPFIVMEYVEGPSVDSELQKSYRFSPAEATRIVLEAARGLKAAHDAGILHRDVKPANLLMTKDGRVKVADFGLAKLAPAEGDVTAKKNATLSIDGQILGTPAYMAPEQAEGKPLDARADIYALGVTYYELLTGERPFKGATPVKVIASALNDPVRPPRTLIPAISEPVERACLALMARNRQDRPSSIDAAIRLLEGLATGATAASPVAVYAAPVAPPPGPPSSVRTSRPTGGRVVATASAAPPPKKLDWGLLGAIALALVVVGGVGNALHNRHLPKTPAAPPPSAPPFVLPALQPTVSEEDAERERANAQAELERQRKPVEPEKRPSGGFDEDEYRRRMDALTTKERELTRKETELHSKEAELRPRAADDRRAQFELEQTRREIDSVRLQLDWVAKDKVALLKEQEAAKRGK